MFDSELASHVPFVFLGAVLGVSAFGVLMLALLPVLRQKSRVSLPKGFIAIMVSFAMLSLGAVVAFVVSQEHVVTFLVGELLGLFACWALLAVRCMTGGRQW